MIFSDKFYFTDIYYCIILCSGPKGNLVMLSVLPSLLITMMSCSLNIMIIMPQCALCHLYPPAPGCPSGMVIMGSMEMTIPGLTTVSMSSLSSRPASRP